MKTAYIYLQLLLLLAGLLTSCVCEDEDVFGDEATVLTVNLLPTDTGSSTRTISDGITDANIIVFDADGNITGRAYQTIVSTADAKVSVETRKGSGFTVCVITNTGDKAYLDTINTLDALKKKIITVNTAKALGEKTKELLYGQLDGVTISDDTVVKKLSLNRLYSKFTFTITPADTITILDYQLCHVPLSSYIVPGENSYTGSYANFDVTAVSCNKGDKMTTSTFYVYENLAGESASSNSAENRNSKNAPEGASYLLITAKGDTWKSLYRIYLGGTSDTEYTDFNIPRNYNYTYEINIDGSGEKDARVIYSTYMMVESSVTNWSSGGSDSKNSTNIQTAPVDYYFSDGTWGKMADHASSTVYPIGVVFSYETSEKDKEYGFKNGYAMALKVATNTNPVKWSSSAKDESLVDWTDLTGSEGLSAKIGDKDGYDNTIRIIGTDTKQSEAALEYSKTNYPAFWYARNFGTNNIPGTEIYAAPTQTVNSGWYLPSGGQMVDIFLNLGEKSTFEGDGSDGINIKFESNKFRTIANRTINAKIRAAILEDKDICGKVYADYKTTEANQYIYFFVTADTELWTSTEYNTTNGIRISYYKSGSIPLAIVYDGKTATHQVRPVIAF